MRTITNNLPLILIIVGITIILITSFSKSKNKKRTRYRNNSDRYSNNSNYNRNYNNSYNSNQNKSVRPFGEPLITETTALSKVSNAQYFKRPLMNRSEYKLFRKLEKHLEKFYKGQIVRLFSQVAMGEFLGSENDEAFRLVNAKRVDFVIVDSSGEAVIVIEYQGAGHYQENAVERDAIKREACRKAGIEFLEFKKNYDDLDFERVSRVLNMHLERKHSRGIKILNAKNSN